MNKKQIFYLRPVSPDPHAVSRHFEPVNDKEIICWTISLDGNIIVMSEFYDLIRACYCLN